jgi:hypothetical protein
MRFSMATVVALTLVGCSPDAPSPSSPNPATPASASPSPTAATNGWIWAMAVDNGGACIADATFEVVSGQGPIGGIIRQQTPCGVWDYDGGVNLRNLTIGVAVTLRATAPGYNTVQRSVAPKVAGTVEAFELAHPQPQ